MSVFSKKDPTAGMSDAARHEPHSYQAPKDTASGRVACLVCGRAPDDSLHGPAQNAVDSEMHWS